jgi:PAS domain S-box-containing protein
MTEKPTYEELEKKIKELEYAGSVRIKAEEELYVNEERLRLAMQATRQSWFDLNLKTMEVTTSPEFASIIGAETEEMPTTYQGWVDSIHHNDRSAVLRRFNECMKTGEIRQMEYRMITRNKEWKWIHSSAKVVTFDENKLPVRMTGTHMDITERKKTEEALRRSEEKYRLIADNISDNIWILNLDDLCFSYVSPSVKKRIGFTPEEVQAKSLDDILSPASYEHCMVVLGDELAKEADKNADPNRAVTLDIEEIRKDGATGFAEITTVFLRDKVGKATHILGVTRDTDARKRAEIQLQQAHDELERRVAKRTRDLENSKKAAEAASLAKSEFLANMSHELRTPLNHIIGFTEIVADEHFGQLNDTQKEYLSDVIGSSRHLLALINDILDISKLEAGKLDFEPAKIRLKHILVSSLVMIKDKSLKRGIQTQTEFVDLPKTIDADERKLKQILYNLLSNAVKFTSDKGFIKLKARTINDSQNNSRMVEISVQDSGIGLSPSDINRIFKPFEQVESSRSRRFHGTGLGLSLTKVLVELHKGKIWAESDGLNKGSTFYFRIPFVQN